MGAAALAGRRPRTRIFLQRCDLFDRSRRGQTGPVLGVVVAVVGAYILVKYLRRRLPLRALRPARISREGLEASLVDLRIPFGVAAVSYATPGAPPGCSPTRFTSTGRRSSRPERLLCCCHPNEPAAPGWRTPTLGNYLVY